MPAIQSLKELQHIREEVLQKKKMKAASGSVQVIVVMGSCSIGAGACDTLSSLLKFIETEKINGVTVTQAGCPGRCEEEPMVLVAVGDQPMVAYGKVDSRVAEKIMRQHVQNGQPVEKNIIQV